MFLRLLGIAQDAGVPHIGCRCARCEKFRSDPLLPACVGIVGERQTYLVDATPAIARQIEMLPVFPESILLTHAHMGHIAGLLQLGKEAWNRPTTIYASPSLCGFLEANAPWNQLPLACVQTIGDLELEPGLHVEWVPVQHRAENSDTHAFLIRGPQRTVLYLPDIDAWDDDLESLLARCDVALLDGTFYSRDELPRHADVPHPPIEETLARLGDQTSKVRFVHVNHTNRLLDEGSELLAVQGEDLAL
ncbi:MAG: MBL fold metallo-hydrolase [Planctomycetota bacterium]